MNETSGNEEEADYDVENFMSQDMARLVIDGATYYVPKTVSDEDYEKVRRILAKEAERQRAMVLQEEIRRQIGRKMLAQHIPTTGASDPLAPPKGGQFLLSIFTPLSRQEEIIGDLDERFVVQVARYGLARARAWYLTQTFYIGVAFGVRKALQVVGLAKLFGMIRS